MPENWRETLFVWDGILTVDKPPAEGDPSPLTWTGTWVGVDNADATKVDEPKRGAFDAEVKSDMTFEVLGTAGQYVAAESSSGGNGGNENGAGSGNKIMDGPFKATLTEGSGWDLKDETTGKVARHTDTVHDLYLKQLRWLGSPDKTTNIVYAIGHNDFGPFISAGWMRPGNRITLGRRYLDGDRDGRAKWDLDDLRKAVLEEVYNPSDGSVRVPPWKCSVLHVDDQSGKRRKKDEDEEKEEESKPTKSTAEGGTDEAKAEDSKET